MSSQPQIGKIYQHELGGIVQIIKTQPVVGAWSLIREYYIPNFKWHVWQNRCHMLERHDKMLIPCLDCGQFCRQQCQIKKPNPFLRFDDFRNRRSSDIWLYSSKYIAYSPIK